VGTSRDGRSLVLGVLADGDWHTAIQIREATGLSQSTVSTHLTALTRRPWNVPAVETARLPNPHYKPDSHGVPLSVTHYRLRPQ
jgi:DNA-binding HxlR family transcriptional regulator